MIDQLRLRNLSISRFNSLGWPAHVNARSWGVGALGDGVIDPNAAAIDLLVTHGFLGRLGVFNMFEVDEAKPARTSSLKM